MTSASYTNTTPHISQEPTTTPEPITADHLDALLQIQRTEPFCKCISKRLLNGKAHHHEFDTFYPCQRTPIQTRHRCWQEIPHPGYPQILEIHSTSRSP